MIYYFSGPKQGIYLKITGLDDTRTFRPKPGSSDRAIEYTLTGNSFSDE